MTRRMAFLLALLILLVAAPLAASGGITIIDDDWAHTDDDGTLFATALWRPLDIDTKSHYRLSWTGFDSLRSFYAPNFRLVDVEKVSGRDVWGGIWRATPQHLIGTEADRVTQFPTAALPAEIIAQRLDGFELVDIEVSYDGTSLIGLWHPDAVTHRVAVGLTLNELLDRTDTYHPNGWRLVDVETYKEPNNNPVGDPDSILVFEPTEDPRRWVALWRLDPSIETYFASYDSIHEIGSVSNPDGDDYLPMDLELIRENPFQPSRVVGVWEQVSGIDWWIASVPWDHIVAEEATLDAGGAPYYSMIDLDLGAYYPAGVMPTHGMPLEHSGPTLPPPPPPN
ncbi:MAG: hypothetical protein AAGD38_01105 [Acidobacteriota bacterium]